MAKDAYRAGSAGTDSEKWQAVADLPRFVELMRSRRRFVVGALVTFSAYTLAFLLVCGYAPRFVGQGIVDGFTIGMAGGWSICCSSGCWLGPSCVGLTASGTRSVARSPMGCCPKRRTPRRGAARPSRMGGRPWVFSEWSAALTL